MKGAKRIIIVIIVISIAALILLGVLFMSAYPPFGRKPSREQTNGFRLSSSHFEKNKFVNSVPTSLSTGAKSMISILRDYMKRNTNRRPAKPIAVRTLPPQSIQSGRSGSQARVTWFGHSALMLEIDGRTLLLDPMLGRSASPVALFGSKRYSNALPIEPEALPAIDAVLLSHDHYDHLDYPTIMKLKDKVGHFHVPLGVGSHLTKWGIAPERISEHDWWDEFEFHGLTLACTPARHFSGRSLLDRDASLWCSWVIRGSRERVFFSGDSGYGPHFTEIGDKYGPFDIALMECGQYDERWAAIHMMPEETVQAFADVRGSLLIPIHWAAFTLSLHAWTDPVERAAKEAHRRGLRMATPRIGEPVSIGSEVYPAAPWWRD